jgi:hypothetical protein
MQATVEYSVDVPDEMWIDYVTKEVDLFSSNYIGYWACGVEQDDQKGWLIFDEADEVPFGDSETFPQEKKARAAWNSGNYKLLPKNWYVLDKEFAIKAYLIGCKEWGADWFDDGDAIKYDVVIQLALFGETKYG